METPRLTGRTMVLAKLGQQQITAALFAWARSVGRRLLAWDRETTEQVNRLG